MTKKIDIFSLEFLETMEFHPVDRCLVKGCVNTPDFFHKEYEIYFCLECYGKLLAEAQEKEGDE